MSGARVRIALVGAGRMGSVHLKALQAAHGIEPVAVVDPAPAARAAVESQGIPVHESVEQLLDARVADAVLIAAPSDQHPQLVATFASAGVPVLCEKPLGVRVSDAVFAAGTAEEAGILLQVGYWRRFVPELRELRMRIATGKLGVINQLSCMQWDAELPSDQYRAHSGGIAIDMGVHEFDQTRWLLDQEIGWVAAVPAGRSLSPLASAADPDAVTILAELSGGAAATISLGRQFPHADSCWIEIWGTEGYARVPFMWDTAGEEVFLGAMIAQAESFARAVVGAEREGAGGEDAVAALTAAERVTESLADVADRSIEREITS